MNQPLGSSTSPRVASRPEALRNALDEQVEVAFRRRVADR
jgi:hypothetical protein